MKKYFLALLVLAAGCKQTNSIDVDQSFTKDLTELQNYFHIPGMAAIVAVNDSIAYEHYFGYADLENKIPMDSTTEIHMASLTKIFSAVAILNAEDHESFLEEPINKYVTDRSIADSIRIKHVLSHTSQGEVGRHFYYSNRYSWLTTAIEKKYNKSFKDVIDSLTIDKLNLKNTYLLDDSIQLVNESRNLARPYVYDGQTKPGFVDYGYSASAGIASTVRDMWRFSRGFGKRQLLSAEVRSEMYHPKAYEGVYGYGIFSQQMIDLSDIVDEKMEIVWGYGQYDCYSALFVKIPDKGLTFVLGANNNLLSDPARLIYGDITSSMFALTFLKYFAITDQRQSYYMANERLFENSESLKHVGEQIKASEGVRDYYLRKLKAQAVAESFMAVYDPSKTEICKELYRTLFQFYSVYEYADLTMLHGLMTLKEIAIRNGQIDFTEFDHQVKDIAKSLLEIDQNNPYANVYMGQFYSFKNSDSARVYYDRIANAKNFSRWWYTVEAESWLKQNASSASGKALRQRE